MEVLDITWTVFRNQLWPKDIKYKKAFKTIIVIASVRAM